MKRTSKKLISLFLMLTMVLSLGMINVGAEDYKGHWAQDAIDFVIDNEFWTAEGDFEPDKDITRAEFSALIVRSLKAAMLDIVPNFDDVDKNTPYYQEIYAANKMGLIKGDGNNFYPDNTITREEAAAILDRASYVINGKYNDATVDKGRFKDFAEISEWAHKNVFNAMQTGVMHGNSAMTFNPKGLLTRAESATITKRISEMKKLDHLDFTVRDAGDGEEKNFPVLNYGTIYTNRGVSGFAVLARFEKGPGEVYFSRKTEANKIPDSSTVWDPCTLAKVIDPDGNTVALINFFDMTTGKEARVVTVNCDKPGIYTFQMMNGRNGDRFEIGIKEPKSWGIRGEKYLEYPNSVPKNGYVYTQRTCEYFFVGSSTTTPFKLLDLEGNLVATSAASSKAYVKHAIYLQKKLAPNTVYNLQFPDNFSGRIVTDGFPGLISPTPEMAEDLKGGWFDEDGVVTQGPLQRRARKRAVEIAKNENLDVVINRPAELPTDLQNPMAEAQMFGAYGVISGIGAACARQEIDPESRNLGRIYSNKQYTGEAAKPGVTYEACNFPSDNAWGAAATAISIPLELNYAYGNKALTNRLSLSMLYFVTEMGEDYEDRQNNLYSSNDSMVSMFAYDSFIEAFLHAEPFLDAETRAICYETVISMGNKMMDYPGQGVTNQGLFHPLNNLRLYNYHRGNENYKYLLDAYHHQMSMLFRTKNKYTKGMDYIEGYGYHEGHFIESGFDSSYEYMNREEWFHNYQEYNRCLDKDPELLAEWDEINKETLYFESVFTLPQPNFTGFHLANSWTSRTENTFGSGNQPSYEQSFHLYPEAALRQFAAPDYYAKKQAEAAENNIGVSTGSSTGSGTYPQVINTEEWAWAHMREFYPKFEHYYTPESGRSGNSWPETTYEAFHAEEIPDYSHLTLPAFQEDGIKLETSEVFAIKHKGIYLINVWQSLHVSSWQKPYGYVGGAPVLMWTENVGVFERSNKVKDTNPMRPSADETTHACVVGKVAGQHFNSGREGMNGYGTNELNTFTWLEEGKKWEIAGVVGNTTANVIWTYELTDTGIDMAVRVEGVKPSDELWLNYPINASEMNASIVRDLENGKIEYKYGETGQVNMTWDGKNESKIIDKNETCSQHRLRIKIPMEGLTLHFDNIK